VLLVLIVELPNSAVEAAIDRVSCELHDLSMRAEDLGGAAVFLPPLPCGGIWAAAPWQRLGAR
jgi:diacylglycerol kinase (ATP)